MLSNKVRTLLTMLGIIIGIASIMIVYSTGEGIFGLVVGQVQSFGTDIIETEIKVPSNKKGQAGESQSASAIASGVQITTLVIKDMEDVRKIANVKNAYGAIMSQEQVSYRAENRRAFVLGTTAGYIEIDKSTIASGRFFTDAEDKNLSEVAVLGFKMKDKLFGDEDPIGKTITLRKHKFTVIGVMTERGGGMFLDFDNYVYVPLRTLQKKVMGLDYMMYMVHQLKDPAKGEETAAEAASILRVNHKITDPNRDDFRVVTMSEALGSLKTVSDAITLLLLGIVIISLIVGGVGIMNVMYVVVTERTMEIGLRKAVGATVGDILWEFLVESVVITTIGGLIGIVVGIGVSALVAYFAQSYGFAWSLVIPAKAYVVSIVFSMVCGVFFGLYPARKAALLDPIEAIRTE
ncbi:MAG: ABC transporter permease [Candidatus Falkowbacteria bacterium]